jgi:hypothetical protein
LEEAAGGDGVVCDEGDTGRFTWGSLLLGGNSLDCLGFMGWGGGGGVNGGLGNNVFGVGKMAADDIACLALASIDSVER